MVAGVLREGQLEGGGDLRSSGTEQQPKMQIDNKQQVEAQQQGDNSNKEALLQEEKPRRQVQVQVQVLL